jgi:hypothetical protein
LVERLPENPYVQLNENRLGITFQVDAFLTKVTQTTVIYIPTAMDYLELICSVGGMAVALYALVYLLVRTWTKNSLKTKLLGNLYKTASNRSSS